MVTIEIRDRVHHDTNGGRRSLGAKAYPISQSSRREGVIQDRLAAHLIQMAAFFMGMHH